MSQERTLHLQRPQGSSEPAGEPALGQGTLRRRLESLIEIARAEHSRLSDVDAERELRRRENYGGE